MQTLFLRNFVAETTAPDVSFVPPLVRRRLTAIERSVVALVHTFEPADQALGMLFATRYGELQMTHKLLQQYEEEHALSPAGFTYSVHNASPGVNAIITGNTTGYNAIAAGPDSLRNGYAIARAEVLAHPGRELMLVYAEAPSPAFYDACIGKEATPIAFACIFTTTPTDLPAPEADLWQDPHALCAALTHHA